MGSNQLQGLQVASCHSLPAAERASRSWKKHDNGLVVWLWFWLLLAAASPGPDSYWTAKQNGTRTGGFGNILICAVAVAVHHRAAVL